MHAVRFLMLAGLIVTATGCAGKLGGRSSMARLQSQVNMLDERVTQLERSSFSSAGASTDTSAGAWAMPAEPAPTPSITPAPSSVKISSGGAKPSTSEIQQALKNAGFYQGAVDGKLGPVTRQAISEFQRVNGLTPDGVVGRQTWSKLSAYADLSGSGSGGEVSAGEPIK
jgi:peptidoglycan hydrolase-like protein with peptidoglycan-binding domain